MVLGRGMSSFSIPGFDLEAFVAATLAEDLGQGLPGGGHDVTSESVIPADARFTGTMDSRDAITVCGLPIGGGILPRAGPADEDRDPGRGRAPASHPAPISCGSKAMPARC